MKYLLILVLCGVSTSSNCGGDEVVGVCDAKAHCERYCVKD